MLIEDLPEVIYTVNEHGVITGISPAIERLSLFSTQELIGRNFCELALPRDRAALMITITASLRGDDSPHLVFMTLDRDGTIHHLWGSHHLKNRQGDKSGLIGVLFEKAYAGDNRF